MRIDFSITLKQRNTNIEKNHSTHKTDMQGRTHAVSHFSTPFTGKERDEETGYGYFGARYMDHELMTMWLSVDPMADKYPGISPYAYCAWNPMKLVDPDGEDIWEIDSKGNVTWKEKSNENILCAIDNRGKRISQINLKDENILKQLIDTKKCCMRDAVGMKTREGKIETATSFNKKDIANLFVFVSQNTDVEWCVYSFRKGKSSKYGIGTFQWDDLSPGKSYFKGLDEWNTFSMMHSHPRPRTQDDETESLYGDRYVAKNCNYKYYTYMPYSKNLYRLYRNGTYENMGKQTGYKSLLKYL